jgi:sporulation protein YlmC with PRC-barrel domain
MPDKHAEERKGANRLDAEWLDGALHFLDRQVLDSEGMNVCNVDDLEITDAGDRELSVTGLLVGPAALVPRFSGRLGGWLEEMWVRLGVQYAGRELPLRIGLDLVEHVGSDVRLRVPREGLLDRQSAPAPTVALRRLADLLGMDVVLDGRSLGHVLDARLRPRRLQRPGAGRRGGAAAAPPHRRDRHGRRDRDRLGAPPGGGQPVAGTARATLTVRRDRHGPNGPFRA